MINVDSNVWFMKEWKITRSLDLGSRFVMKKIFLWFCDYLHVFCFWIIRLELNYRSKKIKAWVLCGDVGSPQRPLILN